MSLFEKKNTLDKIILIYVRNKQKVVKEWLLPEPKTLGVGKTVVQCCRR